MQKHLFILDPLENLNLALDSSLRLAFELSKLGHVIYGCEPWNMYWDVRNTTPAASCYELKFLGTPESGFAGERSPHLLSSFSGIHMRKDPPFDMDYISTTWLLEPVQDQVQIFNSPSGLRGVNEKLSILDYPKYCAPALVSCDPEAILEYVRTECGSDAVIKPLTLFGGKGIERITVSSDLKSVNEALLRLKGLTENGRSLRLCQPFNQAIYQGEVRAFTIGGEPLAWCLKKPSGGQFMANSNFGSMRSQHTPTKRELEAVSYIAKDLQKKYGISIIGFDIIGGMISEINVTSPRLLQAPDDHRNYYVDFANWIVERCKN